MVNNNNNNNSGLGHAAANALVGGSGGEEGEYQNDMMDGGYSEQGSTNNAMASPDEHPCAKYWEQFQHCMNFNSSDISACQQFYNTFNKCNANPSSFI